MSIAIPKCDCPVIVGTTSRARSTKKITNHTLACLRERRGGQSLEQYYGLPHAANYRPRV